MKRQNRLPSGWNNARVRRVLDHYEGQTDAEAVAEDEAPYRSTTTTVMNVPVKLVPAVRALLGKPRASLWTLRPNMACSRRRRLNRVRRG